MNVVFLFLLIFFNSEYVKGQVCVAVHIDGYYPLYSEQSCAVASSPYSTATEHTCARHTCNNVSWVAPCSIGQMTTKFNCLGGVCKKLFTSTCQTNRMLTGETRYGGTCSIPQHSGPDGTKHSCEDNGGTWTWMATLEACRDYAVTHHYTYFSFRANYPDLQCMMGNVGIGSSFVSGFTSCESADPAVCTECSSYNSITCPTTNYEWVSNGNTWNEDFITSKYYQPDGLIEHLNVWYGD